MSTINQQPLANPLALSDLIAVWSSGNSDTRRASLTALLALIQANIVFPTTPITPGDLIFLPFVGGVDTILASPAADVVLPAAPTFGQTIEWIASGTNTGPATIELQGTYPQPVQDIHYRGLPLTGGEIASGGSCVAVYDGAQYQLVASAITPVVPVVEVDYVCQGRLTLTSGTPVTTADVTAAETAYFTPYKGDRIDLYDTGAAEWVRYNFTEIAINIPDATQMNDVFIYNNAGVLTADIVAWATDVLRAVPLAVQDGIYCKSGALDRRYVGSFYSTTAGNGQTEDSAAKRYVWNYYNRVLRPMVPALETTNSWTYTTAAYRQANASAANQLSYCMGVLEDAVSAAVYHQAENSSSGTIGKTGVGVDSSTVNSAQLQSFMNVTVAANVGTFLAAYRGFPGIGRHDLRWLEYSNAAGTTTWYGDNAGVGMQSGIQGELLS
jgi:hypothetical protein